MCNASPFPKCCVVLFVRSDLARKRPTVSVKLIWELFRVALVQTKIKGEHQEIKIRYYQVIP